MDDDFKTTCGITDGENREQNFVPFSFKYKKNTNNQTTLTQHQLTHNNNQQRGLEKKTVNQVMTRWPFSRRATWPWMPASRIASV